jgi:hypothetical protein
LADLLERGDLDVAKNVDQSCVVCGAQPTAKVRFIKMQGMLIVRRTWRVRGFFCQECGLRKYEEFQTFLKAKGWWSIDGLLSTPIYMSWNNSAAKKLRALQPPMRGQQQYAAPQQYAQPQPFVQQ